MGRRRGAVNYKNEVLIKIVGEILPNGEYGWQAVAIAYQDETKEETSRDTTDLKKHWIKNLCNNMKKPTGRTGKNDDRIHRCMAIEKKIMKKLIWGYWAFLPISTPFRQRTRVSGGVDQRERTQLLLLLKLTTRLVLSPHLLIFVILLAAFPNPQPMPVKCWYSRTMWCTSRRVRHLSPYAGTGCPNEGKKYDQNK